MGKFIITEEEKRHIKSLYEQDFRSEMQDLVTSQNQSIQKSNIQNRFGQELFNETESLAKKMGMTLMNNINNDNSFYMWGKNLSDKEKLILVLANEQNDNPITAYLSTWVDRDNGKSSKVEHGNQIKYYPPGGNGTYPSFDSIMRVNHKFFDRIEPEMTRISNMFK
jgi:hypothetical protein